MSDSFIELFSESGKSYSNGDCKGYAPWELELIERLYNIKIYGGFKKFLLEVGRCDGGIIGDGMIQLYRPTWRARQHLIFQLGFFDQMQEGKHFDYLGKPFVFSFLSETQYCFIRTSAGDNEKIYWFDSNYGTVKETEWDFTGFIKMLIHTGGAVKGIGSGDLLKI